MKKIFTSCLICVMLCASLCFSASGANISGDAEKSAEVLKELNLFRGTDKGFELERQMTRAEAAAMLVRFLGAEEKAMSGSFSHPFTDVPAWAEGYVGWLYRSGLTKGVSKTLYGSQQPVTAWQYATFITRALRDEEEIPRELATPAEIEKIDKESTFLRADAAIMSIRALGCQYTKNENYRPLADVCIERGMFTA
ncbi:MAG: S-layer homology domain-containing protein, partial [Oscillospiraceae bacterium]|nr:S-layer homology domain-containing protein [Oscillospiraceae bacterium]